MCPADITDTTSYARVAQLVEHDLAKVGAAGSSPVSRSGKRDTSHDVSLFFESCRTRSFEVYAPLRSLPTASTGRWLLRYASVGALLLKALAISG